MARISSTNITFNTTEGYDEIKSWKKARQEYIIIFGKYLLKCNESELIQIFDDWEHSISDHESVDKIQNYMIALLTISILHHFNRSYDQIKEHIPFAMTMLQHKSRILNKVSSLVFKYLAIELTDNIEFLRDLLANYVPTWIETDQTRYSGMLILNVAGKIYFSTVLLPNVFSITSNQIENLWSSAISDDLTMRTSACKCIDIHFRGLHLVSNKKEKDEIVLSIFSKCIEQIKLRQATSHGAILICHSIFKNSLYHLINVSDLNNSLLEIIKTIKSELLNFSAFSLILEILKKMPNLFNSDSIQLIFINLIVTCQKFTNNSRLFYLIDEFIKNSNPSMIPINNIINFLKAIVKSPRYKTQQQISFSILKTIFIIFKDFTVPASFFLDAGEISPQFIEALRLRIPLLNELKSTLSKHFLDGLGPKATKNQALLSLYILKSFGLNLFNDREFLLSQILELTVSRYEEVRTFVSEVLPLFQSQSILDELIVLALFDESKNVRLSATKQLVFPEKLAHNEVLTQILGDPSFKVRRAAIPIVAKVAPLNPLLFVDKISLFVEKSIRSIMSSSDPHECARLSSLFPLIAEFFIPLCEAYVPQMVKLCVQFLKQRSKDDTTTTTNNNNSKNEGENNNINKKETESTTTTSNSKIETETTTTTSNSKIETESTISSKIESENNANNLNFDIMNNKNDSIKIDEIPYVDLSHDDFPLILNKNRIEKNCTNMRRIYQLETQEWIDIRDINLLLTIQKLANYLTPYVNEIVQVFIIIFSASNTSEFVLSSSLDSFIEIIQKIPETSSIPSTHQNLILELMALLRRNSTKTNSAIATTETIEGVGKEATEMEIDKSNEENLSRSNSESAISSIFDSSLNLNEKNKCKCTAYDFSNSRKILSSNSSIYSSSSSQINNNNFSSNSCAISIAVKVLILMGKLGVNSFPTCREEKSTNNDPISDFDFRSSSFYTEFTISELLKMLKESNSSIYEVITAIFIKESENASKFLGTIVESFSESLTINKGLQKDILFNQLEVISYYAADKMTPYTDTLLPHIINNINSISALRVAIVLSYFLKTEFIPTIQPLFQIGLHFFHKIFASKLIPVIPKPQQITKASSKSHFSLMNLKSLLKSSSNSNSNSNANSTTQQTENSNSNSNSSIFSTSFSSNKYQIPPLTNDSTSYVDVLLKFLAGAVIFQNQPIGLLVSECERAITLTLPKNHLPLSTSSIERLSIILHSLIMIVQLGDASFECANITRICIRLLKTPLRNLVYQLLFSLSIYCHLSPDVIDFLASEENKSNPSIQTLRDYLKDRMIPLDKFLLKMSFDVSVKIPDYVLLLSKNQRKSVLLPPNLKHQNNNNNKSSIESSKKISDSSSSNNLFNDVFSSSNSDSFPKSTSTIITASNINDNVDDKSSLIEASKSFSSMCYSFVFKDFPRPQFRNIEKWFEDLCNAVVADSPSIAIRSCSRIVQHTPAFRRAIFPIAFLSCWRITQIKDRIEFSKSIQEIFEKSKSAVTTVFLKLAELLLRVGHPFIISNFIISKSCQSPAMALRFLVRHYKENPTDYDATELILTLNMRLGRIGSSAGILKTVKLPTAGTWYEKIGDWNSALKFYIKKHQQNHHHIKNKSKNENFKNKEKSENDKINKNNENDNSNNDDDYELCKFDDIYFDYCTNNCEFNATELTPILRCCTNLEKWEEIRKMSNLFDSMNEEEKKKNAVWYAWAFYKLNDLNKVYYYAKFLEESEDLNIMLFKVIFYVASNQTDEAKKTIYRMMQILIHDCSIYSALNASQADDNLTYVNYLVEVQEVLEYRELKAKTIILNSNQQKNDESKYNEKAKEIVERWRRRLEYHNGDTLSWLRLVEICNLAVRINENQKTYMKLMSFLLKKRKFEIIHAYWKEMLHIMYDPSVQILYHKVKWELGKKRQTIQSMQLLKIVYTSDRISKESFCEEYDKIPQYVKDTFYNDMVKSIASNDEIEQIESENDGYARFLKFGEILRSKSNLTQKEKGRLCRIEASFQSQLYQKNESLSNLVKTINLYKKACDYTPDDHRNWAGFAYSAMRAIGSNCDRQLNDTFVLQAMNGFLRATQLHQSNNLVYLLQLFSLFFRYGGKVTSLDIPDEIVNLGPEIIIQILPQIVCQINHSEQSVQKVVHEILIRFSENHFQALVFSLHVLVTSEDKEKSSIAAQLLEELSYKNAQLAKEANILVQGLLRAAVTWYEMWMIKLDAAYLVSTKNNNYADGVKLLQKLFNSVNNPRCKLDMQFIEKTKAPISTCATSLGQFVPIQSSFHNLWFQLKRLYHFLRDKFKQLETIELEDVSEELFNYRNFLLSVPGTYKVTSDNDNNKETRIFKIDPKLPILTTQQNPRQLFMYDMSGKKWKFLLKGNEDLRLDQRIMQFFNLINILIKTHKATSDLGVTIQKYPIIPFALNAGLISWVVGADTLHELVMDYRKNKMIKSWAENDWISSFAVPQHQFDLLLPLQKCEIWDYVSAIFPANELCETFWEKTPDAVSWIHCVDTFALTTALMSIAGYIIGLGDRHPSNILIQRQTGHVIHIDFGDSFEVCLSREKMPEKVPFRLTRMIVNAFGVSGVEGTFRNGCVNIMRVLRENKSPIIAQLEIFVHEPIFQNKENDSSTDQKNQVLDRIIQKLNGKDPVDEVVVGCFSKPISNVSSRRNSFAGVGEEENVDDSLIVDEEEGRNEIYNDELNVEEQVDRLIKIASDPYRYVQHYIGWCQFW